MELKNTIAAMVDSNYKARFAAEYIGNPALLAKLMKLIWTVCNKTYFKDADDIGSSRQ